MALQHIDLKLWTVLNTQFHVSFPLDVPKKAHFGLDPARTVQGCFLRASRLGRLPSGFLQHSFLTGRDGFFTALTPFECLNPAVSWGISPLAHPKTYMTACEPCFLSCFFPPGFPTPRLHVPPKNIFFKSAWHGAVLTPDEST